MKKRLSLLLLVGLLTACEQQQTSHTDQPAASSTIDSTLSFIDKQAVQQAKSVTKKDKTSTQETKKTEPKTLDLHLRKGDLLLDSAPPINNNAKLPNLFEAHKPPKKRVSVGGKLLLDDTPHLEFRESVQGAQMSIQVTTP